MTSITEKKRSSRFLRYILLPVLCLCLLITLAYLMIIHHPSDYRPMHLNEQQQQLAEESGWKKSQEFYNNIHIMQPFTISFEQLHLNNLLLLDETEKFLDKLSENSPYRPEQLQIRITDDSLQLMGQIRYKGINTVLTIGCEPVLQENGCLKLTMLPVKVGAISIPHRLMKNYLAQAVQFQPQQRKNHDIANNNELSDELIYNIAPKLRRLIDNRYVIWEPVFRAVEDKLARITNVRLTTGRIELEIQPLPMNN